MRRRLSRHVRMGRRIIRDLRRCSGISSISNLFSERRVWVWCAFAFIRRLTGNSGSEYFPPRLVSAKSGVILL
jgi:hypothetical protein